MREAKNEIPFNEDSVQKCECPKCPVQTTSACAKDWLTKMEKSGDIERHPGIYCSTGQSDCPDLDLKQMCICGACAIWHKYKLMNKDPKNYYCQNGEAKDEPGIMAKRRKHLTEDIEINDKKTKF